MKLFVSRFFVFLVMFTIMSVVVISSLFISLLMHEKTQKLGVLYNIRVDGSVSSKSSKFTVDKNNCMYMNLTELAFYSDMTITDDKDNINIVPNNNKGKVEFISNSRQVFVNDVEARLNAPVLVKKEDFYIPVDFFDTFVKGLDIEYDDLKNTIVVNMKPDEIEFLLKSPDPLESISEDTAGAATPPMEFISDLTEYEKYISPANRDEYLNIINKENKLSKDFVPLNLIEVKDTRQDGRATQKLCEYAAKSLEALLIEARANGVKNVTVTSAYRSYGYQEQLFSQKVEQYSKLGKEAAYNKAATIVAIPGTSEHQSGLCLDMHNLPSADESFANTTEAKWLAENSYKFGFILRFPKDKVDITEITFEPWHFRYVGSYHATQMYNLGMCFEEYIEHIKK